VLIAYFIISRSTYNRDKSVESCETAKPYNSLVPDSPTIDSHQETLNLPTTIITFLNWAFSLALRTIENKVP
jgi:hypothetical protein